jgi:hypothetical protein
MSFKVIDNFDSYLGWVGTGSGSFFLMNDHKEFIAGNLLQSTVLQFKKANDTLTKTFNPPIDVSGYDEFVMNIVSTQKGNSDYKTASDFLYKISFGANKEFYLPAYKIFQDIQIDISGMPTPTIEQIKITALADGIDELVLSYGIACKDEMPVDIFDGLKKQLDYEISIDDKMRSYLIGVISGKAGDKQIIFSDEIPWLDRYMTIRITDGVNTEYHTINDRNEPALSFNFLSINDGLTLSNDYTNAGVFVAFPVFYGTRQKEIQLPGIAVWTFESDHKFLANELDTIIDTWDISNDNMRIRQEGYFVDYPVIIDCEARHDELLAVMSTVIKRMMLKKIIWVNGRKITIDMIEAGKEVEPVAGFELIPKVQYKCIVQIKEEVYKREIIVKTTAVNITANVI